MNLEQSIQVVICGFPGVGKTTVFNKASKGELLEGYKVEDSDSSRFPKDDFPNNYLNQIEFVRHFPEGNTIQLVSSHVEVRKGLQARKIPYVFVVPHPSLKEEYLQRYKDRGSPDAFITLLNDNWDLFTQTIEGDVVYQLNSGEYLEDFFKYVANNKTGD